ncbi:MAG: glycosyltransferase family 4 protein [Chloroflexota bacterium]
MKILYFTRAYNSHDYRFLSGLAGAGEQVSYLTLERGRQVLEDRALPPQVELLSWSRPPEQARLADGGWMLGELRRLLRQVQPDLLLAGPLQRSALLAALAGFHPLIGMSWGYDLLIDAPRSAWWQRATRFTLKRSAALLGDCATVRDLAVSYGMPAERIVTFPWGVDLAHFSPAAEAPHDPGRPFTMLCTRSWEPVYGVDVLAKAFILAAQQRPEMRLVLLGGGSQAGLLRQALAGLGPLHTLQGSFERVLFPGQAAFADLPRYYRSADLYVSPSHSDGASISLLEAMACGVPALVSDIPGNREWIVSGENGWLFRDGDPHALAQAILHAAAQRERLPEMGRAARRTAEQRADWSKNFPKLYDVFEIALNGTH